MDWKTKEWLEEHYHNKKMSYSQIAKLVNVSITYVRITIKKLGMHPRTISEALKTKMGPWDNKELLSKFYNQGMSIKEIANHFNVNYGIIQCRLKKFSIKCRNHKEATEQTFINKTSKFSLDQWCNYGWLYKQYIIQRKSIYNISDIAEVSYGYVRKKLIEFKIKLRNNSEASKLWQNKK